MDKSADCVGLRPHLWNGDNDNSVEPLVLHKLSSREWILAGKDSKVSPRSFFTWQDFILKFKPIHLPYLEEHLHPFQLFLNALFHLGSPQCKPRKSPLEAQVLVCKVQEIQGVEGRTKKIKGVMAGDQTSGGEHTIEYTGISERCTPETNIMLLLISHLNKFNKITKIQRALTKYA